LFIRIGAAQGQDTVLFQVPDTLALIRQDTTGADSIRVSADAFKLESRIDYHASDSLVLDLTQQKAFLYREAELNYQTTNLKAGFVEIDFDRSELYATFQLDSLGKEIGKPVFKEDDKSFTSKEMRYNFETEKGLIKGVITQEGEGYIHGTTVKRLSGNIINVKSGSYTTCSAEHPHFEMRFNKAKVIPDKKIVTGPAYLVVEDVPLPVAIPFGLFPIFKGRTSGVIFPTYGESKERGFFLENGGYYFGLSDYFDLKILGDIYSRGSWAIKPSVSYKKRYKFGGNFSFSYALNRIGEEGTPEYKRNKDFSVRWVHSQDPKSMPGSSFTANVNFVTKSYNTYNPVSTNDYLSNTFQSSISYQKSWAGKYNLATNLNHSQNTIEGTINLYLPKVSFSVSRFYPFRKKEKAGELKWYENISMNYTMNAENSISTYDSLLFTGDFIDDMRNGVKHSIPISSSIKLFKYLNMTNSINYTGRWYFQKSVKYWTNDTLISGNDTTVGYIKNDTVYGFNTVRDFGFSSSIATKFYGILQFKKGPVRAVRHVVTPSVSFSLRPDFGNERFGYWDYYYTDETGTDSTRYSYYQGSIYGTPPDGQSGNLAFSLMNNLEMKVRSKKDTITGQKKIMLIDNFSINTSYDFAKDSLNWAPISMSGRTKIFKTFNIQFNGLWDLYALDDSTGRRINTFQWEKNKKLLRFDNTTWNLSFSYRLGPKKKALAPKPGTGTTEEMAEILAQPEMFLDWSNPWSLNLSYNLRFIHKYDINKGKTTDDFIQTLSFNGDVSITPKWKIGFTSGYDFEHGEFSYTNVSVYRDLHCWEMRFNWIPAGPQQSWNFSISAKSPMLQDMKLQKKKDFRDNL
jgi:hypothetical protein